MPIKDPRYDLELERLDTGKRLGFVFAGGDGKRKFDAIQRSPYPRGSLQTYQGGSNYDSQVPPYRTITQQDWTGGRGQLRLEADTTRFFDSVNLQTWLSGKFFLGGLPTWATGYDATLKQDTPTGITFQRLTGTKLFIARSFVTPAEEEVDVILWLRRVGSPGNLNVSIRAQSGSNPGSVVETEALAAADVLQDHAFMHRFVFSSTLTTATTYFIVVTNAGTDNDSDYWELGTENAGAGAGRISSNGSAWDTSTIGLHYINYDNGNDVRDIVPFIYKHQAYAVVRSATKANSTLYMAGDRGAADANTGALTTLIDATKSGSWTTNEWAGDIVMLTAGVGTEETTPWRTISSNTTTALTVSSPWLVEHTTDTEYVIISKKFQSLLDLGGDVTDIALAGDYIYFARGEDAVLLRYQAYNNAGAWTARSDAENVYGVHLLAQREPIGDEYLWVSRNDDNNLGPHVQRFNVPFGWGDLYQKVQTIASTSRLWSEYVQPFVTPSVLSPDIARFTTNLGTTGIIVEHDLEAPIDLRVSSRVGINLRHTGGSAPAVTMKFSDTPYFDQKFQPEAVLKASRPYRLPAGALLVTSGSLPTSAYFYDSSGTAYFSIANAAVGDFQHAFHVDVDASDLIYLGHTDQFNLIEWVLDSSFVNAQAAAVTAKIWDGTAWTTVGTVTDGTASGGATLAQNGTMTWTLTDRERWTAGRSSTESSLSSSLYWVQLSFSAGLDVISAHRIMLENSVRLNATVQTTTLTSAADADDAVYHVVHRLNSDDWLYFIGNDPFDEIKLDLGSSVNDAAATMTGEYFNGEEFVAVSNLTDGTASSGDPLKQDGSVTFNLPDDMGLISVNSIEGYCVRLAISADAVDASAVPTIIQIIEAAVRNRRQPIYTEYEVAPVGNEINYIVANSHGDVLSMLSGDILYFGGNDRFDTISWVIDGTINNAASKSFSAFYHDGENWVACDGYTDGTASGGASLAQDGDMTFDTGVSLMQKTEVGGRTAYWLALEISGDTDDVLAKGISLQRQNTIDIALSGPTLVSGQWSFHSGAIQLYFTDQNGIDMANIQSVAVSIDALPTTLDFRGGLLLTRNDGYIVEGFGARSDRITGLELYGQLRQNPWVFTEGGVYEIQTQNNNDVAPIPLRELSTLRHPLNGRVHTTNDTYLYFNLGAHIQRYFNQTLDNIGWTREEGLPDNRSGDPTFLLSAPGGLYAGVDAGSSGYSSVMFGQARAWHTLFLAPQGMSVNHATIQSVPGGTLDRMWVNVGKLLMFLPIPSETFDPTHDSAYIYQPEGSLITCWISDELYSIKKIFKELQIYAENLTSSIYIKAFYQEETGDWDGAWTAVPDLYDESPFEAHDITASQVTARRLRYRINLRTNDHTITPIVFALLSELLERFTTKHAFTFQHRIADNDEDKQGIKRKGLRAYKDFIVDLDVLGNALTLCRVHSYDPQVDGKIVVVEPSSSRPIYDASKEHGPGYILETTLLEA